jgi:hypothetical protein
MLKNLMFCREGEEKRRGRGRRRGGEGEEKGDDSL